MVLQFNPPQDLVNAYLSRPSPGQEVSQSVNQALQTYVQQRAQEQALASLDAQRKAAEFKAVADYVPEAQIPEVAKQYGITIPTAGSTPPIQSTGTAITPNEMVAQQSLPSEHPVGVSDISPNPFSVIDAHTQASGWNPLGRPTSKAGLAKYKTGLEAGKLERDLATDPNAPVPVMTKEAAVEAGQINPRAKIVEPPQPKDTSAQDAKREDRIAKAVTDYGKQIENHPVIKKLNDQQIGIDQVQEMTHLIDTGNTVASSAMGTKMARAMGEVGALTETDIKRYVQSGKLTQGAGDALSKWTTGTPSNATMAEIKQIASTLKDSFASKIQPIYDRHIDRFSRAYKMSPEEASHLLAIPYSGGKLKVEPVQSGPYSDAEKEARYQAYKAKQGRP